MKTTIAFITCMLCVFYMQAQSITVEAEDGILQGTVKSTYTPGYSGTGYVMDMVDDGDQFTVVFPETVKGTYNIVVRYHSGYKTQDILVNNLFYATLEFQDTYADWADLTPFTVYFHGGGDSVTIRKNWGYGDFDKLTATPVAAQKHDYSNIAPSLIDAQATEETKKVYDFLRSNFGTKIISGQTFYWNELLALAEKTPVIHTYDFQNYSPHNPWHTDWSSWDDGSVQSAIDWYNSTNKKGIVGFLWHWFSPSDGILQMSTFNTASTNFDASKAILSGTQENKDMLRDIDTIAYQLKRLSDAGIPVLWRPMHEASGTWFWWGAKGSAVSKTLWDIMYDRLTNFHGLHNLIWIWSSPEAEWYPGNSKVDIMGYDSYPGKNNYDARKTIFDDLYTVVDGQKIIGMTENGPIPDPTQCLSVDAPWSFFSSWGDLVGTENSTQHIKDVFSNTDVITLENIDLYITSTEKNNSISNQSSLNISINNNQLFISGQSDIKTISLQIMDLSGRNIINTQIENTINTTIPLNHITTGIYIYRLTTSKQVITGKLYYYD